MPNIYTLITTFFTKEQSLFDDYFFKKQYDYLNGFVDEI